MRRSVRLLVLLAAIVVTGVVAWRSTVNERHRAAIRAEAATSDTTAADTLNGLADLRASLHAYVAPGQNQELWSSRAATLLKSIRTSILDVDAAATIAGHPLAAQTIDDLDRLTSSELRARAAVQAGQPRLAGDIIFTDARDRIDAITAQVAAARKTMARAASSADVGITNAQSLLAGALLAIWLVTAVLLVPLPPQKPQAPAHRMERGRVDPLDLSLQEPSGEQPVRAEEIPPLEVSRSAEARSEGGVPSDGPALSSLASLCSDLGRVSNVGDLDALMKRGADLLGASGLVVWVASRDGMHLDPAAIHGYGAAAIASIPLSEENITVSAFTTAAATRAAAGQGRAAVAVPLASASGTVGVLAAEMTRERDLDIVTALATVMAAQIATLFQPPAPTTDQRGEASDLAGGASAATGEVIDGADVASDGSGVMGEASDGTGEAGSEHTPRRAQA